MKNLRKQSKSSFSLKSTIIVTSLLWTAVTAIGMGWNLKNEYDSTMRLAHIQVSHSFSKDLLYRHWAASHGGIYVPITEETPPNPYLTHIKNRDVTTTSGLKLTLMNPAYMTRQVYELEQKFSSLKSHITSLKPIRPENSPDEWEANALKEFEDGKSEVSALMFIDRREYLRMMRPMITEKACLKCHAQQGYKVGDVRGGISVSIPMSELSDAMKKHMSSVIVSYTLIWLLGIGGIVYGASRITRRIREKNIVQKALLKSELEAAKNIKEQEEIIIAQSRQAAMGEMIAMIAHQWRQPISVIGLNAGNLLVSIDLESCDPETFKRELEKIEYQVEHLSNTIDDFRNFFKPNKTKESSTVEHVITNCINIIEKSFQHNNITLELNIDSKSIIQTYPNELLQVLLNLLNNSKDITLEREVAKPTVKINSYEKDENIYIEVCDNGGGIDDKYKNKIFNPYFSTKGENGTGLGLYMSKTIVDKHLEGTISFANKEDSWFCFTITLPKRSKK